MSEAYLGEIHSRPAARCPGRVARRAPVARFQDRAAALSGVLRATCREFGFLPAWLRVHVMRCAAIAAVMMLGLAWFARGTAGREEAGSRTGLSPAAMGHCVEPGSPGCDARPGSLHAHGWHKRFYKVHRGLCANDPSDDGTSRDPDDDNDTSDDLNCDDETNAPILTHAAGVALYLVGTDALAAPASTDKHFPLFLTLQRLRC